MSAQWYREDRTRVGSGGSLKSANPAFRFSAELPLDCPDKDIGGCGRDFSGTIFSVKIVDPAPLNPQLLPRGFQSAVSISVKVQSGLLINVGIHPDPVSIMPAPEAELTHR